VVWEKVEFNALAQFLAYKGSARVTCYGVFFLLFQFRIHAFSKNCGLLLKSSGKWKQYTFYVVILNQRGLNVIEFNYSVCQSSASSMDVYKASDKQEQFLSFFTLSLRV